jgi:hypothetical protein
VRWVGWGRWLDRSRWRHGSQACIRRVDGRVEVAREGEVVGMQMARVAILSVLAAVAVIAIGFETESETATETERQPELGMSGSRLVAARGAWRIGCAALEACLHSNWSGLATSRGRTSARTSATWGERQLGHSCASCRCGCVHYF